jgi:hypothetical protein
LEKFRGITVIQTPDSSPKSSFVNPWYTYYSADKGAVSYRSLRLEMASRDAIMDFHLDATAAVTGERGGRRALNMQVRTACAQIDTSLSRLRIGVSQKCQDAPATMKTADLWGCSSATLLHMPDTGRSIQRTSNRQDDWPGTIHDHSPMSPSYENQRTDSSAREPESAAPISVR